MKKSFLVPAAAVVRSLVCPGLLGAFALAASADPVTFRVNMSVQAALGNFVPASDHTVEVHGSFDGWGAGVTLSASGGDPSVYQATVEIAGATGSQVQYKYVINQAGPLVWENDGVGPAGAQNRAFNLTGTAQTLDLVYFNNQSVPPGLVAVTFQVNLAVQEAIGNFNSGTDAVEVRGSFDNWAAGLTLSVDPNTAGLYRGTININGSPGAAVEHKYVINQAGTLTWEDHVGPGGPNGNRVLLLGTSPQILPPVYFNNLTNAPGTGIPVTFQVDLAVATARGQFDPAAGTIFVAGPFNNWGPTTSPLTNSPAHPSIYSTTLNITTVSPGGSVSYKYVLNGGTWETGDNRVFTLASTSQTLPPEPFDRIPDLGPLSISVNTVDAFIVTLNWVGGPRIWLQSSLDLNGPWEDVPGTLGQSTTFFDLSFEERPPTYYRLIGP